MLGFRHLTISSSSSFELTLSVPVASPNVRAIAIDRGWNGTGFLVINVNANINTLDLRGLGLNDGWHINIATGVRVGGVGGDRVNASLINGGDALSVDTLGFITNRGVISGGGGGGGIGQAVTVTQGGQTETADSGEPGRGEGFSTSGTVWLPRVGGSAGQIVGVGPTAGPGNYQTYAFGGNSGGGGQSGQAGEDGGFADVTGPYVSAIYTERELGGLPGLSVRGNSFITWYEQGTLIGSRL